MAKKLTEFIQRNLDKLRKPRSDQDKDGKKGGAAPAAEKKTTRKEPAAKAEVAERAPAVSARKRDDAPEKPAVAARPAEAPAEKKARRGGVKQKQVETTPGPAEPPVAEQAPVVAAVEPAPQPAPAQPEGAPAVAAEATDSKQQKKPHVKVQPWYRHRQRW